jgi:hypothetical protein
MIVAIIIHENWTSSSFSMREKKEKKFGKQGKLDLPKK